MAKTKISEFSATPANNTDIDSINIAEGCAPSGINDAIRELMAQLKDFQTGAVGDSFNGPVGTSTAAAGAFTTLAASGSVTLSGGTANGVTYLNGSKVLTSGSALTFDGTNLATTGAITSTLATTGAITATGSNNDAITAYIENSNQTGAGAADRRLTLLAAGNTSYFGVSIWQNRAVIEGNSPSGMAIGVNTTSAPLLFYAGSRTEGMRLTSTGLGIGTSSPSFPSGSGLAIYNSSVPRLKFSNSTTGDGSTDGTNLLVSGSDFYIQQREAASVIIATNGADRATIDSAGNLGLGVTPSAWNTSYKSQEIGAVGNGLIGFGTSDFAMSSGAYYDSVGWKYSATNSLGASFYEQYNGQHIWYNKAPTSHSAGNAISFTQAMTLDADGDLGVGITSPLYKIHSSGTVARKYTTPGTTGSPAEEAGFVYADDGSTPVAGIWFFNTFSSGNTTQMAFKTRNSAGTVVEAVRIDASQNLLVGTTSATGFQDGLSLYKATGNSQLIVGHGNGAASGNAYALFYYNGTVIGSITQSGTTAVLYNTTSDQRLKENIQNADSASSLIDSLQVRKFDWKADGSHQRYGFVAQELVTVYPEAVHQPIDTEDMMAVDYSKLVPLLVKEIQSLKARLDAANL
jgi:hypothetical protein